MAARTSEAGMDRTDAKNGRAPADGERREGLLTTRPSRPYGFWLALASIVVIAAVYAVTMVTIGPSIRTPATAIAAMTAVFPVISALVGAYFGVKAGLDGQEKAKEIMDRALREESTRNRAPG